MTTARARAALLLDQEWADIHPDPSPVHDPALAARAAAEDLAAKGRHVHLVSGDVTCLNHRVCVPLPGV